MIARSCESGKVGKNNLEPMRASLACHVTFEILMPPFGFSFLSVLNGQINFAQDLCLESLFP